MSVAVLEKKYNSLSEDLKENLDLYLDFLVEKMGQKNMEKPARKNLDFSMYNMNSKIWNDPQQFVSGLRNEERC